MLSSDYLLIFQSKTHHVAGSLKNHLIEMVLSTDNKYVLPKMYKNINSEICFFTSPAALSFSLLLHVSVIIGINLHFF